MHARRLADALPQVRERIEEAATRAGRSSDAVRIVAVTKGHPLAAVEAALAAGLRDIGENRLGELEWKHAELGGNGTEVRWHMVGHLQSRKAPRARELASVLHSLDSLKLARRFERTAEPGAEAFPVLVQVNTSGEESKYGFSPGEFRDALPELVTLGSLRVEGLMTMAPLTDDREVLRGTFRRLRRLHEEALEGVDGYRGGELSMGMSNDYDLAVEEGSTLVRLGTVLFGERPQ